MGIGDSNVAAPGIGRKLKTARLAKGLVIDDISRDTRIAHRFIEAIETEDYSSLPGLLFTRNFIRQYALVLGIAPEPLLAELPRADENTAPLPNPPAHPRTRSSYRRDRQIRAIAITAAALSAAALIGLVVYLGSHYYAIRLVARESHPVVVQAASPAPASVPAPVPSTSAPVVASAQPAVQSPEPAVAAQEPANHNESAVPGAGSVTVSLTASARAWIRLDVDGKTTFMGTLAPNETREVSANEQIRLQTGNAGALTVSLNGKTLDSLGRFGQFREVRMTAEGPEFLPKDPRPQPSSDRL